MSQQAETVAAEQSNGQTESLSPLRLSMRALRRHRMAMHGFRILVVLYAVTIFSDFFAPYHYDDQRRDHSYHPPLRPHFYDDEGNFSLRPFVYGSSYTFNDYYQRIYTQDRSKKYYLRFFARGQKYRLLGLLPTNVRLFGVDSPGRLYLLGADHVGRDVLSRVIYGSRVSMTVGLLGTSVSLIIGLLIGGISGYYGGTIDLLIQRLCELIMLIPGLYLLMILYSTLPAGLSSVQVYFGVVFILAFIGWAGLARVIRGMVLSIAKQDFVTAAVAAGLPGWRIIVRHVLPSTLSYAIVAASLSIPAYILGESALSLIGMGIQDPVPSWGNMLQKAVNISELAQHPWILWPGFFIFVAVMAFNFVGDGLRDAFDPGSVAGQQA